mmetsp:Transcript_27226/g.87990  ORF Transcript_27226/g.87990 Transcript_27226/m.87990 type:complete len:97 (-) Transcript_27226:181-471(-)
MLESITTSLLVEAARTHLGVDVQQDVFRLGDLHADARAMWILSTTSDLPPVTNVGDFHLLSKSSKSSSGEEDKDDDDDLRKALLDAIPRVAAAYDE